MDGEGINGVRMTWNYWPKTKVELRKCVIPLATSISPIHYHPQIPTLPYAPLRCKTCQALLNPYATVDFTSHIWVCPFCYQRNHFPPHYTGISETTLPGELYPQHTTAQYALPCTRASHAPHVYLFVIDTCLIEEELGFVKSAVLREINFLPRNGVVGLITYGAQVHVHELGFTDMNKVFIFRGSKNVSKDRVLEQLGLGRCGVRNGGSNLGLNRFLLPANDCEYALNVLLDELPTAQRPVQPGSRASRCTGVALSIAAGLLGAYSPGTSARIIALVGGPCTEGPGRIVSKDLSKPVRSHKDLDNDTAPYFQKAVKFYDNLAKQLVSQGHVLDLFASALDQVGVAEMKVAVEKTGGLVVLAESFGHSVFKDSFKRLFQSGEQSLGSFFNGMLEVYCSKDIKIQGIIGPCTSLEKKGVAVADTVIGQGNTTAWKLCSLDKTTYLTVFFDVSSNDRSSPLGTPELYLQFLTSYQDPEGKDMLRVTTVCRRWVENSLGSEELVQGFDQETAAVVMTRLCSQKMESEEGFDATRWLDRNLIRLCSKFGDFRKDDPTSFNLNSSFSLFPQLMFNLRRSQFVQVFNNSPDETASFRMLLNRESITNAAVMIQPSLISYSFNYPPSPALLDVSSIVADRILLLDSYFSVVIFHGMTIAQWRNMGYQDQAEHQAFAQLLRAPRDDAQIIIQDRFPVPRLVVCDQHGSQARFLLAKLNPSATYNKVNDMAAGSDVIFTDDVSLQVFYEHLQRLVVQS